jgi:ATP-dependent protease ClpP protease subunit
VGKRPFRTTRRLANLRQGRNDWYQIKASSAGAPTELRIYDEIGFFGITAEDLIKDLDAAGPGDLDVHIHCPGGDVFEALAIYNALCQRDGMVRVTVDSLAASAASFIAQAADPGELFIAKSASIMIHDAFGFGIGNSGDMRELADLLDEQSDNIAGIYAERSGLPVAQWREAMRAESWYLGQAAVDAGLADAVQKTKKPKSSAASWDLSVFARAPGQPPRVAAAAADESAWDAGKAWANGAASDDPAAFYNGICAGKKAGDPATQGAHALPHHYHPGDAPNRHGVSAALGRIDSADGLTDKAAAQAHLDAHKAAMGDGGTSDSADLGWFIDALKGATQ